jgi:uncharacterized protein involved in cysteine biosynthesis
MFYVVLIKALRNLLLPGILKVLFVCLLAYMACFSALAWIFSAMINHYTGVTGSQGWLTHIASSFGGMFIAHLFFPLLYPILISFFDDRIADIIEHEDYPQLPPAKGLNILCLPLYILFNVFSAPIYFTLNGYLLGTQFFRIVAGRRVTVAEAESLHRKSRHSILMIGIAISFFATVPVINFVVPLLGIAAMLHLFHALRGTKKQEILPPA